MDPANLTLATLTKTAGSMADLPGDLITRCVELLAERAVISSKPLEHIWRDAVYEIFLKPSGIGDTQAFFHTAAERDAAIARNPEIFHAEPRPLTPRRADMPVLYHIGTLEGPATLLPLENNTYVRIVPSARGSYVRRGPRAGTSSSRWARRGRATGP